MNIRPIIITLVCGAAAAIALVMPEGVAATTTDADAPAPVTCQEDMDCWDCETMGNRICGPDVAVADPPVPTTDISWATSPPATTCDLVSVDPEIWMTSGNPLPCGPSLDLPYVSNSYPIGPDGETPAVPSDPTVSSVETVVEAAPLLIQSTTRSFKF